MSDESFAIDVSVTGDTEAVSNLSKVVQAENKITEASHRNTQRVVQDQQTVGAALTAGGQKWGQLSSAVGNLGPLLGRISPQLGAVGQAIGQVGTAASALTGAMGPLGIGIAVVSTAAAVLVPLLSDTSDEMREVGEQAETAADRVRRLGVAIEEAAREGRRRAGLEGSAAALSERGTLAAQQEALERATVRRQARLRELAEEGGRAHSQSAADYLAEQGLRANRDQGGLQLRTDIEARELIRQNVADNRELLRIRGEIELVDQGIANANAVEADAARREAEEAARQEQSGRLVDQAGDRAERRSGGADEAERRFQEEMALEDERRRIIAEQDTAAVEAERQRDREHIAAIDARVQAEWDASQQIYAFQQEQSEREKETLRDRQEFRHAQLEREKEDARAVAEETAAITNAAWESVGNSTQQLLGDVFRELQKGSESTEDGFLRVLDAFLEAKAIEWGILAVAEGAAAVASFASYQEVQGVAHLEAAAQYAVAAGLAGGAGAAINVPAASSARAGAEPPPPGSGGAGGGNLTVNLYAPNAVLTEAERGQILASGLREARRSYGNSAVDF